ncbi:ATP-binding cassette domain-containing protein [Vagococcus vulneris]|uniref:ABC transporter domain-containing protein n=1 Tax=Vagococcus vulneris TaxID=1977869 RepID=A0A429ZWR0_9ENTE|nr:ATP-binding cassette domain-containing protein [Vagococcus vulneris]RST98228.1 hypothetical protein CBF37_08655 [Vagococcus vulneris]
MSIQLKEVSKSVEGLLILNDINLTLENKTIYGLIGQNDSGKTTLLRILANLRFASEGYIEIDGKDVEEFPRIISKIYFQSQDNIYPKHAKLKRIIKLISGFYSGFHIDYCQQLLKKYNLNESDIFNKLSIKKQMLFRSCLAFSIDTDYILLDDPTFSLDASYQHELFNDLKASYKRYPKTFVLSTHSINEIQDLVDNIIIIEDGQIIVEDKVQDLIEQVYMLEGSERDMRDFLKQRNVLGQEYVEGNIRAYARLTKEEVSNAGHLQIQTMDLQELFIRLTRNPFKESKGDEK